MLAAVLFIVALSFYLPYTHFGKMMGFVPISGLLMLAILAITVAISAWCNG